MTLATRLKQWGVSPVLIEQRTTATPTSRAMGVHQRTLEVLGTMGVLDTEGPAPTTDGSRRIGGVFYKGGRVRLEWPIERIGTRRSRSPFRGRWWPQAQLEEALLERYQALGGRIEFGVEAVGLDASKHPAEVFTADQRTYLASWVIACDGGRSAIRRSLGVAFDGKTHDYDLLLADVDLDWPDGAAPAWATHEGHTQWVWLDPAGPFNVWRMPRWTGWRLMGYQHAKSGTGPVTEATPELMQKWFEERTDAPQTRITGVHWLASWKLSERMLADFRHGRVFFAGDAAHIHSPLGGQGLNGGIQDAYNLAWKLASVELGHASEGLLDTYSEERAAIARLVLRWTRVLARIASGSYPLVGRQLRDWVAVPSLRLAKVRAWLLLAVSQVKVNYRNSSLSASEGKFARGALRAGERMPEASVVVGTSDKRSTLFAELSGACWQALLLSGTAHGDVARLTSAAGQVRAGFEGYVRPYVITVARPDSDMPPDEVTVLIDIEHDVHDTFGVDHECMYLVRPDGYVGLRSRSLDPEVIMNYLRPRLGTVPSPQAGTPVLTADSQEATP
jgi:4,5-epoxidase